MPRVVDGQARRGDILEAALTSLATNGAAGLSFRAVAKELGGSSTLVTHYYPTRRDLIVDLTQYTLTQGRAELAALEQEARDPRERLSVLLHWLIPGDEAGLRDERGRFALLAATMADPSVASFAESWEQEVRTDLRERLSSLVSAEALEDCVDVLRVVTSGVSVGAVEHPDLWAADRQHRVVSTALTALLDAYGVATS